MIHNDARGTMDDAYLLLMMPKDYYILSLVDSNFRKKKNRDLQSWAFDGIT
jgi:hypothetical protein